MNRNAIVHVVGLVSIAGLSLVAPALLEAQRFEAAIDRPGFDIANFDLPRPDPAMCQAFCSGNPRCKAWTYTNPGVQGPRPRCWLKDAVPDPVENECCVSGVAKGAGPVYEENVNRPGYDFSSFDLHRPEPALCQAFCARDDKCRAWTYIHPGIQGPGARCWLKARIPKPVEDGCCVSGIKQPKQ